MESDINLFLANRDNHYIMKRKQDVMLNILWHRISMIFGNIHSMFLYQVISRK